MIKPRTYRKFYRDLKLIERNKDLILPMEVVKHAVSNLTWRQKFYIFFKILF